MSKERAIGKLITLGIGLAGSYAIMKSGSKTKKSEKGENK